MYKNLEFRRQFLLTRNPVNLLSKWRYLKFGKYYFYSHPDLEINKVALEKTSILLIGNIYDSLAPEKKNIDILKDIISIAENISIVASSVKQYSGTYVLLYKNKGEYFIFNDARAIRELYYCTIDNIVVCGSQPNLMYQFSNPKIKPSNNPELLDFYNNHLWDSRWVGNETYFEGIKHLQPNHCLDINRKNVIRYWPNEPIRRLSLEEAVSKCCVFLQGTMKAIVNRHPAMMSVTAGTDSRTLLAASKEIRNNIYYFINDNSLGNSHPDIAVSKKIFNAINVPFNVHKVSKSVDEQFRKIYLNNTFLATERMLPSIYNIFFKEHSEKIFILGVGEIGRTFYGKEPRKLNSYQMAYKLTYNNCSYVVKQCDNFIIEMLPVARKYGINFLELLYWEQRLGYWGGVRNSESLIAIEKVDPYNSHLINEIFFGVDEKYRDIRQNPCILFREMIRNMWPELLEWPFNPAYGTRDKIVKLLEKMRLFSLFKELKYQMNYIMYKFKNRLDG